MRNDNLKDYRKTFIIGIIQTLFFAIVISLVMIWVMNIWVEATIANEEAQQEANLIRMVSLTDGLINPYLQQIHDNEKTYEQALEEIRDLVRQMTYSDQYGPNYLFMSSYDGTMLVQPFETEREGTNQWNLQDQNGEYIIQKLIHAAKSYPDGSFVTYYFNPPNSETPQKKLSYVIGIPEINAYLGTGMYQDQFLLDQKALVKKSQNTLFGLILLMTLSTALILYRNYKNNTQLRGEVTQREEAQIKTKLSEENLLTVVNSIYDAVLIHDFSGNIIEVNDQMLSMFKISKEQALKLNIQQLSTEEVLVKKPLQEILGELKNRSSFILEWKCFRPADHHIFDSEIALRIGNWYGQAVIIAVIRDITDRKNTERFIFRNQHLLEHSQKLAHVGNYYFNTKTRELIWSKELFNIYQRDPKLGPLSITEHKKIVLDDGWEKLMQIQAESLATKTQTTTEYQITHPDGSVRDLFIIMDWYEDENQELTSHTGTIQDITEQKNAEKKILLEIKKLAGLRKIDVQIINHAPIEKIFETVMSLTKEILNGDACSILLLDEEKENLSITASYGFQDNNMENKIPQDTSCLPWQTIRNRNKLTVSSKQFEPIFCDHLIKEGFRSYIGLPIIAHDEIYGMFEILFKHDNEISKDSFDYFELLAGQMAIAIDTSNLITSLQQTNQEVINAYEVTIAGWSKALEIRDEETKGHSDRVMWLACQLAEHFGIKDDDLTHFRRGVFLHDIGKMGIPDSILLKPGPLTEAEWEIMKQHPTFAHRILSEIPYLHPALDIPLYHHEKWDGSGYPEGLIGNKIPLPARIFAVIDVWDALTSDRPYRPAWTNKRALDYISENAGTHFDPEVVNKFVSLISNNEKPISTDQKSSQS